MHHPMHRSPAAPLATAQATATARTATATALVVAAAAAFAATLALPAQAQPRDPEPSAKSRACYAAMWQKPAIAPVIARLAGNSPEATQALRASTDKASPAEKPAITAWQAETKKCQQLPMFSDWPAEGQAIVRGMHRETNQDIADLLAGKISWGQFLEQGIARMPANRATLLAYNDKLQQQRQQAQGGNRPAAAAAAADAPATAAAAAPFPFAPPATMQQCLATIWQDPAIAPVAARVRADSREAAVRLRASTDLASDAEKPALATWRTRMEKCQPISEAAVATWPADAQALVRQWFTEYTEAIQAVLDGRLAWGALLHTTNALTESMDVKLTAIADRQAGEAKR